MFFHSSPSNSAMYIIYVCVNKHVPNNNELPSVFLSSGQWHLILKTLFLYMNIFFDQKDFVQPWPKQSAVTYKTHLIPTIHILIYHVLYTVYSEKSSSSKHSCLL